MEKQKKEKTKLAALANVAFKESFLALHFSAFAVALTSVVAMSGYENWAGAVSFCFGCGLASGIAAAASGAATLLLEKLDL
jgi:hypothetical protein